MANYITTLEDKNQDGILPRTVVKAIADKNGDYLSEDLVKSDIDALKNGKIASMDSAISSLSYTWSAMSSASGSKASGDYTVTLDMPSGATTIIAIFPIGYDPYDNWNDGDSMVTWKGVDLSNHTARIRINSPITQNYSLKYWVVWK